VGEFDAQGLAYVGFHTVDITTWSFSEMIDSAFETSCYNTNTETKVLDER
jgi:hypothetical protein